MTEDVRERAWAAVHDALAQMPGWAVGPCVYHGDGDLWHVTAVDLGPRGRQAKREAITATGATEVGALEALAALLSGFADKRAMSVGRHPQVAPAPHRARRSPRGMGRGPGDRGRSALPGALPNEYGLPRR